MKRYILQFINNLPALPIGSKIDIIQINANYYTYNSDSKMYTFYDEKDNINCRFDNKENVLVSFEERN